MEWLQMARWSPYVVGAGIGVLSWLAFLLSDKALGCSTAFARTAGMVERLWRGEKVLHKEYYRRFVPEIDWEWMLVLGMPIGAFVSAQLSGEFRWEWVPQLWQVAFAILGYCPGTVAAAGQGSLDALLAGIAGIVVGAGLFAASYSRLKPILSKGDFGELTLPELLKVNAWAVVVPVAVLIVALLWALHGVGR